MPLVLVSALDPVDRRDGIELVNSRLDPFAHPDTVADMATYENPKQYPKGIDYVLVNGTVIIDKGHHTGARPGRVVYGPGKRAQ